MLRLFRRPRLAPAARNRTLLALATSAALIAACGFGTPAAQSASSARSTASASATPTPTATSTPTPTPTPTTQTTQTPQSPATTAAAPTRVLVVWEENQVRSAVLDAGQAPYLRSLLAKGAQLTDMDAGYPVGCSSLGAYILATSGSTFGICDNGDPSAHPLTGVSLFTQVARSGREWRVYAESMPRNCYAGSTRLYVVRHTAAPYYTREARRCAKWQVPAGGAKSGPFAKAVASGTLPAFSMLVPNQCNNMHGAPGCTQARIRRGDAWLSRWLPQVLTGSQYLSGELLVVITWDEGDAASNAIHTMLLHPTVAGQTISTPTTHCGLLRQVSDVLAVKPLRCAATAAAPATFN